MTFNFIYLFKETFQKTDQLTSILKHLYKLTWISNLDNLKLINHSCVGKSSEVHLQNVFSDFSLSNNYINLYDIYIYILWIYIYICMYYICIYIHRHVFHPSLDSSVWLGLTSREQLMSPECSKHQVLRFAKMLVVWWANKKYSVLISVVQSTPWINSEIIYPEKRVHIQKHTIYIYILWRTKYWECFAYFTFR